MRLFHKELVQFHMDVLTTADTYMALFLGLWDILVTIYNLFAKPFSKTVLCCCSVGFCQWKAPVLAGLLECHNRPQLPAMRCR